MALSTIRRLIHDLRGQIATNVEARPLLALLKADPTRLMAAAGMTPDSWQAEVLCSPHPRTLILCSRQAGKSTVAAAAAVSEALSRPRSLILLLSPSERQSGELAAKVFHFWDALGAPIGTRKRTELQLHLANGSRIIALPENEKTIRGYSGARLLVVDEASRVSDSLYFAVRPMLAVSRGRLLAMTTPFGKRGWFHDAWANGGADWHRVSTPAGRCTRIPADFLEAERRSLGARWYRQEYECSFEDAVDAVFAHSDIMAAMSGEVAPLFGGK